MADANGCCSNFFSCTAPDFEDSQFLGVGTFGDTTITTLSEAGGNIETSVPYVDPFAGIADVPYENFALAFSGTEMTVDMGYISGGRVPQLLASDPIQNGRAGLFEGHNDLYVTVGLVLPALLLLHVVAIVLMVRANQDTFIDYLCPTVKFDYHNVRFRMLAQSLRSMLLLMVCGLTLIILNLVSSTLQTGNGGCVDPFLNMTTQATKADISYQYAWAVVSGIVVIVTAFLTHHVKQTDRKHHLQSVHKCLITLACSREGTALLAWQANMNSANMHVPGESSFGPNTVPRRIVFWLLHMPFLAVASLPDWGYVLYYSTPNQRGIWYVLGNPIAVAAAKMGLTHLIVVLIAPWLAKFKYGINHEVDMKNRSIIKINQTQMGTALVLEAISVVLSPCAAVFTLDEGDFPLMPACQ